MIVKTPPEQQKGEETLEASLRPRTWDEYIGQEKIKNNLRVIIDAAKSRQEPLEHMLVYGNSGLGKTTLAHVLANEMGAGIQTCSGPALNQPGDLASLLTNLQDGEVLFIDECHRLSRQVAEMLYSAMEDFKLHLIVGKGPMARTMDLDLPRFTIIGATTRIALLPSPLRNRFGSIFQLNFYEPKDMERIVQRSATILRMEISPGAVSLIAKRSRFTPRAANRIVKRVRDFAQVAGSTRIEEAVCQKTFGALELDECGLEPEDRKILHTIVTKFQGGPVGIQTLAASVSEEQDTIVDIYEPYLLQLGFLQRTSRGRVATPRAYKHLGVAQNQKDLL
ncbi:MAG: Holliday junction branch migration DNA helicase RuvB [Candidatus Wildermuthbacteria bacterium]|nr:Holliday junction branch migration DNA helicase RuvB [Candidatus Wildermuthbacteria bacterium]